MTWMCSYIGVLLFHTHKSTSPLTKTKHFIVWCVHYEPTKVCQFVLSAQLSKHSGIDFSF